MLDERPERRVPEQSPRESGGSDQRIGQRRYNNAANRAYYARFQAAIAALDLAGIRPAAGTAQWSHSFVQAQFAGVLVGRRKQYPAELREVLSYIQQIRNQADYSITEVSQT